MLTRNPPWIETWIEVSNHEYRTTKIPADIIRAAGFVTRNLTELYTISKPDNPPIHQFCVVRKLRSLDV